MNKAEGESGKRERRTAILLAAGSGSRMGGAVAKQYLPLQGKPLLWHALRAIEDSALIDDCVLVVSKEDDASAYAKEQIVERYGFSKVACILAGGAERCDSVWQALQALAGGKLPQQNRDGYVFIHDAARPFLTEEILSRCLAAVWETGACAAGMPAKDTIKIADAAGFAVQTPDRKRVWQIQTPQAFSFPLIFEAYRRLFQDGGKERLLAQGLQVTDDAMVVETLLDHPVKLVEGSYRNIKVTTPEDMAAAEAFLTL